MNSKSNCSSIIIIISLLDGVEYTFYGYNIDYMLVKVTLRKSSDKECKSEPYGQLEGFYDLSSPGINESIYKYI